MVLLVKGSTGSFAAAGLVIAAYSIAAAVSLPVQGRVMDRVGQPPVIAVAALVNAAAFLGLIGGAEAGAPVVALAAIATVAGLGTLPTGNAMRTLWSGLVPDQELRQAAFALDAVAIDVAFIFGPLIAAGVIAVATPAASLGVCVALALTGSAIFATSPASRAWRGHEGTDGSRVDPGALAKHPRPDGRSSGRRARRRCHRAGDHGVRLAPRGGGAGRGADRRPRRRAAPPAGSGTERANGAAERASACRWWRSRSRSRLVRWSPCHHFPSRFR